MAQNLDDALRAMENRIRRVKKYVTNLEEENSQLKEQIDLLQDNIDDEGKGGGSSLAKKNSQLMKMIRSYKRERQFLAEKVSSLISEVGELRRNID
jgi:predicted  nucleic acid-binding Zn-ribbon protein